MLIFISTTGALRRKFPVEAQPEWTGAVLQKAILLSLEEKVVVKRLLSGGQVLRSEATLKSCHVQKESTVQCLLGKPEPPPPAQDGEAQDAENAEGGELPAAAPGFFRQRTLMPVRFGEVMVLQLRGLRGLRDQAVDSVYAVVSYSDRSVRSAVTPLDRNGSAAWDDQAFGFFEADLIPEQASLSVVIMGSHLAGDTVLGSVDLPAHDSDSAHPMEQGELLLSLSRAALSSPDLKVRVQRLCELPRAWSPHDLAREEIGSLEQILGSEPWSRAPSDKKNFVSILSRIQGLEASDASLPPTMTPGVVARSQSSVSGSAVRADGNPALLHLLDLLELSVHKDSSSADESSEQAHRSLRLSNHNTLLKVNRILHSQRFSFTEDLPERFLWITGVPATCSDAQLFSLLQAVSGFELKHVHRFAGTGVIQAIFCSAEAALRAFILLQNQNLENLLGSVLPNFGPGSDRLQVSFGPQAIQPFSEGESEEKDSQSLEGDVIVSSVQGLQNSRLSFGFAHTCVASPGEAQPSEWKGTAFALDLTSRWLCLFPSLSEPASLRVHLPSARLSSTGPWSFSLTFGAFSESSSESKMYFRFADDTTALAWADKLSEGENAVSSPEGSAASLEGSAASVEAAEAAPQGSWSCASCGERKCASSRYLLSEVFKRNPGPALGKLYEASAPELGAEVPEPGDLLWAHLCTACLGKTVDRLLAEDFSRLAAAFSSQDLQDIVPRSKLDLFYQKSLESFLAQEPERFVPCPQCQVRVEISMEPKHQDLEFVRSLRDADGNKLSDWDTIQHCLTYRLTCRDCMTVFCGACSHSPYHLGFTCSGWSESRNTPLCRFCRGRVQGWVISSRDSDDPEDFDRLAVKVKACLAPACESPDREVPRSEFCSALLIANEPAQEEEKEKGEEEQKGEEKAEDLPLLGFFPEGELPRDAGDRVALLCANSGLSAFPETGSAPALLGRTLGLMARSSKPRALSPILLDDRETALAALAQGWNNIFLESPQMLALLGGANLPLPMLQPIAADELLAAGEVEDELKQDEPEHLQLGPELEGSADRLEKLLGQTLSAGQSLQRRRALCVTSFQACKRGLEQRAALVQRLFVEAGHPELAQQHASLLRDIELCAGELSALDGPSSRNFAVRLRVKSAKGPIMSTGCGMVLRNHRLGHMELFQVRDKPLLPAELLPQIEPGSECRPVAQNEYVASWKDLGLSVLPSRAQLSFSNFPQLTASGAFDIANLATIPFERDGPMVAGAQHPKLAEIPKLLKGHMSFASQIRPNQGNLSMQTTVLSTLYAIVVSPPWWMGHNWVKTSLRCSAAMLPGAEPTQLQVWRLAQGFLGSWSVRTDVPEACLFVVVPAMPNAQTSLTAWGPQTLSKEPQKPVPSHIGGLYLGSLRTSDAGEADNNEALNVWSGEVAGHSWMHGSPLQAVLDNLATVRLMELFGWTIPASVRQHLGLARALFRPAALAAPSAVPVLQPAALGFSLVQGHRWTRAPEYDEDGFLLPELEIPGSVSRPSSLGSPDLFTDAWSMSAWVKPSAALPFQPMTILSKGDARSSISGFTVQYRAGCVWLGVHQASAPNVDTTQKLGRIRKDLAEIPNSGVDTLPPPGENLNVAWYQGPAVPAGYWSRVTVSMRRGRLQISVRRPRNAFLRPRTDPEDFALDLHSRGPDNRARPWVPEHVSKRGVWSALPVKLGGFLKRSSVLLTTGSALSLRARWFPPKAVLPALKHERLRRDLFRKFLRDMRIPPPERVIRRVLAPEPSAQVFHCSSVVHVSRGESGVATGSLQSSPSSSPPQRGGLFSRIFGWSSSSEEGASKSSRPPKSAAASAASPAGGNSDHREGKKKKPESRRRAIRAPKRLLGWRLIFSHATLFQAPPPGEFGLRVASPVADRIEPNQAAFVVDVLEEDLRTRFNYGITEVRKWKNGSYGYRLPEQWSEPVVWEKRMQAAEDEEEEKKGEEEKNPEDESVADEQLIEFRERRRKRDQALEVGATWVRDSVPMGVRSKEGKRLGSERVGIAANGLPFEISVLLLEDAAEVFIDGKLFARHRIWTPLVSGLAPVLTVSWEPLGLRPTDGSNVRRLQDLVEEPPKAPEGPVSSIDLATLDSDDDDMHAPLESCPPSNSELPPFQPDLSEKPQEDIRAAIAGIRDSAHLTKSFRRGGFLRVDSCALFPGLQFQSQTMMAQLRERVGPELAETLRGRLGHRDAVHSEDLEGPCDVRNPSYWDLERELVPADQVLEIAADPERVTPIPIISQTKIPEDEVVSVLQLRSIKCVTKIQGVCKFKLEDINMFAKPFSDSASDITGLIPVPLRGGVMLTHPVGSGGSNADNWLSFQVLHPMKLWIAVRATQSAPDWMTGGKWVDQGSYLYMQGPQSGAYSLRLFHKTLLTGQTVIVPGPERRGTSVIVVAVPDVHWKPDKDEPQPPEPEVQEVRVVGPTPVPRGPGDAVPRLAQYAVPPSHPLLRLAAEPELPQAWRPSARSRPKELPEEKTEWETEEVSYADVRIEPNFEPVVCGGTGVAMKRNRFFGGIYDLRILDRDAILRQENPDLQIVTCEQANCRQTSILCCSKILPCGHGCYQADHADTDEACLPCLHPLCPEFSEQTKQTIEDDCPICVADGLTQAPVVRSNSCGHLFHLDCLKKRIEGRWSSRRIDFSYLSCPLCKRLLDVPLLEKILAPELERRQKLRTQAYLRLKIEGLHKEAPVTDPESEWYRRPRSYALHHYAFFSCSQCSQPYFGGAAACGAQDEAAGDAGDQICFSCSQASQNAQTCEKHGDSMVGFKCRFCCSHSIWFCFGNTHFCEPCHNDNYQLVESSTGRNKKKMWEYPQCPSLRSRIDDIAQLPLSDDEKEERIKLLRANRTDCPIGSDHPPNGVEFGLGCGLCKDNRPAGSESGPEEDLKDVEGSDDEYEELDL